MRIPVVVLMTLAATPLFGQDVAHSALAGPAIEVTRKGEVRAMPDLATVALGVETHAQTARAAASANALKLNAVLAALTRQGLAGDEVATSSLAVQQDRNDEGVPLSTYSASNTVEIKIRRLAGIGQVIDTALAAGANRVETILFSLANPEPLKQQALALAVEQLRQRAAAIAKAAGGELGPLIEISGASPSPQFGAVGLEEIVAVGYGGPSRTSISPRAGSLHVA